MRQPVFKPIVDEIELTFRGKFLYDQCTESRDAGSLSPGPSSTAASTTGPTPSNGKAKAKRKAKVEGAL